jgi:hypothetical protein
MLTQGMVKLEPSRHPIELNVEDYNKIDAKNSL